MKQCRKCQQEKPDTDFNKQPRNRDGLQSYCKLCGAESSRKANKRILAENPNADRERNKAWRQANPEKVRAYSKKHYLAFPEKQKLRDRRAGLKRYGLTLDTYAQMLAAQGGVCLVCKNPPDTKALAVDHCHTTKKVRGLLCDRCNRAIGHLEDNPDRAEDLAKYLE